jgi:hypothetical protein
MRLKIIQTDLTTNTIQDHEDRVNEFLKNTPWGHSIATECFPDLKIIVSYISYTPKN